MVIPNLFLAPSPLIHRRTPIIRPICSRFNSRCISPPALLPAVVTHASLILPKLPLPPLDPVVFRTSTNAISKLCATLLLGVIAAKRGLLDSSTLKALSKTVYNIFLPALLFTNVVRTLAGSGATQLFFLPLVAFLQVFLGLAIGFIGSKLLRLNQSEKSLFIVCCGFGNSGVLPLLFASNLCQGASLTSLISAISFFMVGWTALFWSLGYSLLAKVPEPAEHTVTTVGDTTRKKGQILKRILSPPLTGAIAGLVVGSSPFLRNLFMPSPLFTAVQTLGTGYGPAAVLILAGSLARKVKDNPNSASSKKENSIRLGRLTFGICVARFLCLPVIAMMMVRRGTAIFTSPFAILTILLEGIMPPAQNSTLVLNLENRATEATMAAKILLLVYIAGILPISIGLTYFIAMAGI